MDILVHFIHRKLIFSMYPGTESWDKRRIHVEFIKYYQISCKNGYGSDNLLRALDALIATLPKEGVAGSSSQPCMAVELCLRSTSGLPRLTGHCGHWRRSRRTGGEAAIWGDGARLAAAKTARFYLTESFCITFTAWWILICWPAR